MDVRIHRVSNRDSPYFTEVISLADKNRVTLGFLPKGAFQCYADEGNILAALDKNDHVCGYLLFRTSKTKSEATIVHLCCDELARGKGVARLLFGAPSSLLSGFQG